MAGVLIPLLLKSCKTRFSHDSLDTMQQLILICTEQHMLIDLCNIITLCMLGFVSCFRCGLLIFFQNYCFKKILSGMLSEYVCQTVWVQIRNDLLLVLIWVQTDCKGLYQQTTGIIASNQLPLTESSCYAQPLPHSHHSSTPRHPPHTHTHLPRYQCAHLLNLDFHLILHIHLIPCVYTNEKRLKKFTNL